MVLFFNLIFTVSLMSSNIDIVHHLIHLFMSLLFQYILPNTYLVLYFIYFDYFILDTIPSIERKNCNVATSITIRWVSYQFCD